MQTTRKWILSICSNTLQHTSRDIEQVSPCVHTTGKTCWGLNIPKPQLHMKYPTRLYHYRPTSSRTANCFCRFAVATLSALTIPSEMSPYLYYCLRARTDNIIQRATGTTFKEISGSEMAETIIPIPPLNEQSKIIEKVTQLQEVISLIEKSLN